eukprot:TRINITY_DN1210_c0_g1_i1.p1 TRINITY_DN1210_c0_g1~~TRINITY_DN1210_c0_g1_i1.p1  ORF type:complete len:573 (+),score=229.85 TRINITY_DN1210_c0_g1_i1:84-1721(+)
MSGNETELHLVEDSANTVNEPIVVTVSEHFEEQHEQQLEQHEEQYEQQQQQQQQQQIEQQHEQHEQQHEPQIEQIEQQQQQIEHHEEQQHEETQHGDEQTQQKNENHDEQQQKSDASEKVSVTELMGELDEPKKRRGSFKPDEYDLSNDESGKDEEDSDFEESKDKKKASKRKRSVSSSSSSSSSSSESSSEAEKKKKKKKKSLKKNDRKLKENTNEREDDDDDNEEEHERKKKKKEKKEKRSEKKEKRSFQEEEDSALRKELEEENIDDTRGDHSTMDDRDNILDQLTQKKTKSAAPSHAEKMDHCLKFVERMRQAWKKDEEAKQKKEIPIHKMALLRKAENEIRKYMLREEFIEAGLLSVFSDWLRPTSGVLPPLDIRTTLLKLLETLPVTKDALLKQNDLGKMIRVLTLHPEETKENKTLAKLLIDRWSRQIYSLSDDFRSAQRKIKEVPTAEDVEEQEQELDRLSKVEDPLAEIEESHEQTKTNEKKYLRATIPEREQTTFVFSPKQEINTQKKIATISSLEKKATHLMRSVKKGPTFTRK